LPLVSVRRTGRDDLGRPRMTGDIDVTAEIALDDVRGFATTMDGVGFSLRVTDMEDFVARTRVLPFMHEASGIPVDVVLAGRGLEEQFLARVVMNRIGTVEVPVISPEDLVVTKLLAGRPKDIDDVRGILRERARELNLDQIRSILELLEEALGQSDLLHPFEAELKKHLP